jgi:hypothetical protein
VLWDEYIRKEFEQEKHRREKKREKNFLISNNLLLFNCLGDAREKTPKNRPVYGVNVPYTGRPALID